MSVSNQDYGQGEIILVYFGRKVNLLSNTSNNPFDPVSDVRKKEMTRPK